MSNQSEHPIIVISDGTAFIEAFLDKEVILIGRGSKNDIPLPSPSNKVSRCHIQLEKKDGKIFLTDRKSNNGTVVNGSKVEPEKAYPISSGDEIKFGEYNLHIYESQKFFEQSRSGDSVATAEHEVSQVLSMTAIARREKLAVLSMKDRNLWDEPESSSGKTLFFVALIVLVLGGFWVSRNPELYKKVSLLVQGDQPEENTTDEDTNPKPPQNPPKSDVPQVSVYEVKAVGEESQDLALNAIGYVRARRQVSIRSAISGKMEHITVSAGEKVTKGKILAKLDQSDTKINIDLAYTNLRIARSHSQEIQSQYKAAQSNYIRSRKLYRRGLISENDLIKTKERAETLSHRVQRYLQRVQTHEHEIKRLEILLKKSVIRAPFDGVITQRTAEVGFVVNTEDSLFVLTDLRNIGVDVDVNEKYMSKITLAQPALLELVAYSGKSYKGKVRKIYPTADRLKATVKVDIAFIQPDKLVFPDRQVKVTFLQPKKKAEEKKYPLIPLATIKKEKESAWVWVVDGENVQQRFLQLGKEFGSSVEVVKGLAPGEFVVTSSIPLKEKQKVRIQR